MAERATALQAGALSQAPRIARATWGRWAALVAFGVGFGYVEAAVVHYLRRILGDQLPTGVQAAHTYLNLGFIAFIRPERAALVDPGLTRVETVREAATLVMLAAVGWLAAETWRRRLAAFFIAFTVWDLTYYLFLRVLDGWPASVMDRDVFFLIPVPWVGPVLTALVASALVLVAASAVYLRAPGAAPTLREPAPPEPARAAENRPTLQRSTTGVSLQRTAPILGSGPTPH
jgi:hypothetical protein